MRIPLSAIILMAAATPVFSQDKPYPQLRLKTGLSRLFISPAGKGYAYQTADAIAHSVVLGGEVSLPMRSGKGALNFGFTFQDSYLQPSPNARNLDPRNLLTTGSNQFFFSGAPAKTVVYGGAEFYLNRNKNRVNQNYFSVVAGGGLAFTLNSMKSSPFTIPGRYNTWSGDLVEGVLVDVKQPPLKGGALLYTGIRYNIRNRKGREIFIAELIYSHGISNWYHVPVEYTVNGQLRKETLREKGINVQLNLIIPLYSFKKKK